MAPVYLYLYESQHRAASAQLARDRLIVGAVRAGLNGTVVLQAVIKTDGTVDVLRVVRGLPLGLTENAIDALKEWQFSPGKKNGQDVDVSVNLEVNFNLRK